MKILEKLSIVAISGFRGRGFARNPTAAAADSPAENYLFNRPSARRKS
jgi:hypothetical protein